MEHRYVEVVVWNDSRSPTSQWHFIEDIADQLKPVLCMSIGWIVAESNECIVLAGTVGDVTLDGDTMAATQCNGAITIPTAAIVSRASIPVSVDNELND